MVRYSNKLNGIILLVLFCAILASISWYVYINTQRSNKPGYLESQDGKSDQNDEGIDGGLMDSNVDTKTLPALASAVVDHAITNGNKNPVVEFWYNDGIYARGDVTTLGSMGGTGWYAVKENGKWTVIEIGQGTTACPSLVDEYRIPKESFPDCYQ